ncbi:MAG: Gfo/Idh/MocA family oxidoreductase [Planctomycetes bacterium]|nr:Gfo/Idh/MocA family oxidoreductase [Planctomycetota bacterium]
MARRAWTRRGFLGGAAGVFSGIHLARRNVFGAAGGASANDTIRIGHIGMGGRGMSLLGMTRRMGGARVTAVCDVDAARRDAASKAAAAEGHADFRQVLDRPDVDAVVIATPDHWHAIPTIRACEAGKDVYVEKPLSHTYVEGRAMVAAARGYGRIVQTGIHHRSEDGIREACEIVRSKRVGPIHTVVTWMWENPVTPPEPNVEPPPGLDWDLWLGPAPKVPYTPKRCHFHFRWFRDYGGGYMTDWGAHMFNVVTWAMDIDLKGPVRVSGTERLAENNLFEFPIQTEVRWEFKNPDFAMIWREPGKGDEDPGRSADKPAERYGMTFHGIEGVVHAFFSGWKVYRDGKLVEDEPKPGTRPGDVALERSPGHMENWLQSIRSRALPLADVEIGHRTTALCHLGNIAGQLGRPLEFDWRRERFMGDRQANRMLDKPYRAPWAL